jgi:hypothetical protein
VIGMGVLGTDGRGECDRGMPGMTGRVECWEGGVGGGLAGVAVVARSAFPNFIPDKPIGTPEGTGHSWPAMTMRLYSQTKRSFRVSAADRQWWKRDRKRKRTGKDERRPA